MVTHASLNICNTHLLVRNHPKRHILRIRILSQCPIKIRTHIIEMIQESPNTSITEATAWEIRLSICHFPREISILALIPALAASKRNDILGIHHVFLVLHIELADATLVSMCTNCIIRNTESYPNHALRAWSLAHHLHNPSFVRITDGKGFAFWIITIGIGEGGHHLDSLACRFTALESNIDEWTIVHDTCRISHLLTSTISSFTDGDLPFIDIANHIISLGSLRNLTMIFIGIPIVNLTHLALSMLTSRKMTEILEHTIVIGTIWTHHRSIYRCFFSYYKVGTCLSFWDIAQHSYNHYGWSENLIHKYTFINIHLNRMWS